MFATETRKHEDVGVLGCWGVGVLECWIHPLRITPILQYSIFFSVALWLNNYEKITGLRQEHRGDLLRDNLVIRIKGG